MTGLLTTHDVARVFRTTDRKASSWARRGILPSVVLPDGSVRFQADRLEQWIEQHERKAGV